MAAHRNRLEGNVIENNGRDSPAAGIVIRGETRGLVIRENTIRDSREGSQRKQRTAIRIEERAGAVILEGNKIEAEVEVEDLRSRR